MKETRRTRREFLRAAASLATISIAPRHVLGGAGTTAASDKLDIAVLGVGGRGNKLLDDLTHQNIVALCDVDSKYAAPAFERFPRAKKYEDYRRMLDREEKSIDAIVVATTDHTHIPISMMALKRGKHCYCEKPLGHNIHEVRAVTELARKSGLATQLGTGAHSGSNYRSMVVMIRAGVIGKVREVHAWCDQAWPPGDRPKHGPPVPKSLNWDLWLGPAPVRPYHPTYHPKGWRSWWDFGNGRLGDMGCHMIDLPFSALDLKYPLTVETRGPKPHEESVPGWLISKWTFPARGELPPVDITWYDGNKRPPLQIEHGMPDFKEGVLFVGEKGMLIADYGRFKLYPEEKFAAVRRPRLPPMPLAPGGQSGTSGHMQEWINACKTGASTGCGFDYSGPLTETVLLGTVGFRAGQKLEWDAENMKVTNCPKANRYTRREYRNGWGL